MNYENNMMNTGKRVATLIVALWAVGTGLRAEVVNETKFIRAEALRCEYLRNPLGIDVEKPRLSWKIEAKDEGGNLKVERGIKQTAYQVLVASSEELLKKDQGDLWDSGKVASDQTLHVVYAGKELASSQRCFWKVRVWDKDGKASAYSRPAYWEMGLLAAQDWRGQWRARQRGQWSARLRRPNMRRGLPKCSG